MTDTNNDLSVVLVVEDNRFNRDGLVMYLRESGYRTLEAGDRDTALTIAARHRPSSAIVDIVLPRVPGEGADHASSVGLDLVQTLKRLDPSMGIVIFSAHEDRAYEVWEMVRDGTRGLAYLLKGVAPEAILRALDVVNSGQILLEAELTQNTGQMADEMRNMLSPEERPYVERAAELLPTLTPRETDVAWRVAGSHTNLSIAQALGLKPKTVETHIANIYSKLGLNGIDGNTPAMRKSVLLAKACILHLLTKRRR